MEKGIILTSFGTTFEETRKKTIEPLEDQVRELYPDYLMLRAFTSRIIAKRLKERGYPVDNPTEALEKMKAEGIKEIFIQPSLIIEGHEYEKTLKDIEEFKKENDGFDIKMGLPLLSEELDYKKVVEALELREYKEDEALVFMGHGTDHITDRCYDRLEKKFKELGHNNVFVGTIEGAVTLDEIMDKFDDNIKKVELRPFMLVAGDHAVNDMASDEEDSWKSILEEKGYEVETNLTGLGEVKNIRDIFVSHLEDIM